MIGLYKCLTEQLLPNMFGINTKFTDQSKQITGFKSLLIFVVKCIFAALQNTMYKNTTKMTKITQKQN